MNKRNIVILSIIGLIIILSLTAYFYFKENKVEDYPLRAAQDQTDNFEVGTISYSKEEYTCKVGETFETMIKASGGSFPASIASYSSIDTNIAEVDDKTSIQTNCIDCRLVRVVCKSVGKTQITAESSSGAKTFSNLIVSD